MSVDGDNDAPIMNDASESLDAPLPQTCPKFKPIGTFQPPPTIDEACMAHIDLNNILRPQWSSGIGCKDPGLDLMFQGWLEDMVMFLWAYMNPQSIDYNK